MSQPSSRPSRPSRCSSSRNGLLTLLALLLLPNTDLSGATLTFGIEGAECTACFYSVSGTVRELAGIKEIEDVTGLGTKARITFDENTTSAHRIAHAVWRAFPLHSSPYRASLTIRIPDYGKAANTAKVDKVLAGWKDWLAAEVIDRDKGIITLRFHPLGKAELQKPVPGWRHSELIKTLNAPPPAGLNLRVTFPAEN